MCERRYNITYDDNIVIHLGRQMYGTVAAAIGELVANAWDADAKNVTIKKEGRKLIIIDDGHGMSLKDITDRFLNVGYNRRDAYKKSAEKNRAVMGRKGIGKFASFTVADRILIETWTGKEGDEKEAFELSYDDTLPRNKSQIHDKRKESDWDKKGTRLTLSIIERKHIKIETIEKELYKRFSSKLVDENEFKITVDDNELTDKVLENIYKTAEVVLKINTDNSPLDNIEGILPEKYVVGTFQLPDEKGEELKDLTITGWLGGALKNRGELQGENKVALVARGRQIVDDVLSEVTNNTIHANSYVFGEIHAEFCDLDQYHDMATSDRQKLNKDDFRYEKLIEEIKECVKKVVALIKKKQNELLVDELGGEMYRDYIESLDPSERPVAEKLLKHVAEANISDDERATVAYGVILSFEEFKVNKNMPDFDKLNPENIEVFAKFFKGLQQYEALHVYPIIKKKIEVIQELQKLLEVDSKEEKFQSLIATNLWLIANAGYNADSEQCSIKEDIFEQLYARDEDKRNFLDIFLFNNENEPVIVELKRRDRDDLTALEIAQQVERYRKAIKECNFIRKYPRINELLKPFSKSNIKGIILVENLKGHDDPETVKSDIEVGRAKNIEILTYSSVIKNADRYYKDLIVMLNEINPLVENYIKFSNLHGEKIQESINKAATHE